MVSSLIADYCWKRSPNNVHGPDHPLSFSITTVVPEHEVLIYRAVSNACGDEVTGNEDNIVERF
jgi:hypothetical protein